MKVWRRRVTTAGSGGLAGLAFAAALVIFGLNKSGAAETLVGGFIGGAIVACCLAYGRGWVR